MKRDQDVNKAGDESYRRWVRTLEATPGYQKVYEEEAAKSELWLQLAEARQEAGLTQRQLAKRLGVSQAQVARLERRGYEDYTLNSLRRYVQALGDDFVLEVKLQRRAEARPKREFARVEVSH
jgi:DNA-binding XRE family transcriptional regulator